MEQKLRPGDVNIDAEVQRAIVHLIEPWERLNARLARQISVKPDISAVTRDVHSLAVAISHFREGMGLASRSGDSNSTSVSMIRDVADAGKHSTLKDPRRRNTISVSAMFEGRQDATFRFVRNQVEIEHASAGKNDFLQVAGDAIQHWLKGLASRVEWTPVIREGPLLFSDEVLLYLKKGQILSGPVLQLKMIRRKPDGEYEPFDPPQFKFQWIEHTGQST